MNCCVPRCHLNVEIADSSQTVGDAGFGFAQPVVVRNADVIHVFEKRVFSGKHQVVQTFRSRFFHPLEAEFEVDGKLLHK